MQTEHSCEDDGRVASHTPVSGGKFHTHLFMEALTHTPQPAGQTMSGSSCDTNATGVARHEALIASLAAHGAPSASRNVLVLNTIDQHYITLIAAWVDMVRRVIMLPRLEACSCQRTPLAL